MRNRRMDRRWNGIKPDSPGDNMDPDFNPL
jgi:hypothetical protein